MPGQIARRAYCPGVADQLDAVEAWRSCSLPDPVEMAFNGRLLFWRQHEFICAVGSFQQGPTAQAYNRLVGSNDDATIREAAGPSASSGAIFRRKRIVSCRESSDEVSGTHLC